MKRFFSLTLVALAASGCGVVQSSTGGDWYIFHQVGVTVRAVNNCAPFLDLETVGGVVVRALPYGSSVTVPLVSQPFGGSNRQVFLTAKGYTANREYLGSTTAQFSVNTYEGSWEAPWEVNYIRLPNGRGGCQ